MLTIAVIGVTHPNKGASDAANKVMGSNRGFRPLRLTVRRVWWSWCVKTEFRPAHTWDAWRPTGAVMRAFVDLVVVVWGEDETISVSMDLERPERKDTAENLDEVRELVNSSAIDSVTSLHFHARRDDAGVASITLYWHRSARVTVYGADETATKTLRDRAMDVLAPAALPPVAEPSALQMLLRAKEEVNLDFASVRLTGTYVDVERLVVDLAAQVLESGHGPMERINVDLKEADRTLRVDDLDDLADITGRDVRKLIVLSVSMRAEGGPGLYLYLRQRSISGSVTGPDQANVRALRAAVNDLLRERARPPHWLRTWMMFTVAAVFYVIAYGFLITDLDLWPISLALFGVAALAVANKLYLPNVELLPEGEKTRWARWSRGILALAAAYLLGCLAIPLIPT